MRKETASDERHYMVNIFLNIIDNVFITIKKFKSGCL